MWPLTAAGAATAAPQTWRNFTFSFRQAEPVTSEVQRRRSREGRGEEDEEKREIERRRGRWRRR